MILLHYIIEIFYLYIFHHQRHTSAIKNLRLILSRAAWRIPPVLMSIIPQNTRGFGDVEKAANVFAKNEIKPLQIKLRQLNQELGVEIITVNDYELGDKT